MSRSSDKDDDFLRIHAKAIAQALQQKEEREETIQKQGAVQNQSQREKMIRDTYVALCHDDPRVESDLACRYLATALLDAKSPYALSGPLVEGIRQLCAKQPDVTTNEALSKGSAMLAWTVYARIPLLCCQAKNLSDVHAYLGSYRPPAPPNGVAVGEEAETIHHLLQKNIEADRFAELLMKDDYNPMEAKDNDLDDEEEVLAAESDPSDFEFESGYTHEQQMTDLEDTFTAWMMDRSDPIKLSQPPKEGTTWKQVRHAVMDLTSQLNYRQTASLWTSGDASTAVLTGGRGPADLLTQLIMTLLVPPATTTTTDSRPSIFDSPDDEKEALHPQRQLQAMAWYPLWVVRDAAAASSHNVWAHYLTLLQTLISVDAAASQQRPPQPGNPKNLATMAPATYVGLASLSALCQKFTTDAERGASSSLGSSNNREMVERYRALRLALWEISDDLSHALEQEERLASTTTASGGGEGKASSDWIAWTLLPIFEILTNQRLQTGSTIVAEAESIAQRHHSQQASQQWSGLLQSGLFRYWMMRLQAFGAEREKPLLWHLMRRSLLYTISQSMSATSALGKYAWRFPNFAAAVEIGGQDPKISTESDPSAFSEYLIDNVLWYLLSMELAGIASTAGPTIQWNSSAKKSTTIQPLPTREECRRYGWEGFQSLCASVVHVLNLACEEENKKENLANTRDGITDAKKDLTATLTVENRAPYHVVLQSFHRFVDSLVACPLLAKIFVRDLEIMASDETKTLAKNLDAIQESLSQYKAPAPDATSNGSQKAKDEDGEGKTEELRSKWTKERAQDASLQEDIHSVRKALKVLRSLVSNMTVAEDVMSSLNITSSSKTD